MSAPAPLLRPTRLGPDTGASTPSGYGLSPRLSRMARERLGQLAVGIGAAATLGALMATTLQSVMGASFEVALWVGAFNLGGSLTALGLWKLTRSSWLTDAQVLDLGLVWLVTGCFAFNLHFFWFFSTIKGFVPPVSPVVLWLVLQPVVVPTPRRRAILSSVAAALMAPLAVVVLLASGMLQVPAQQIADVAMMPLLAAGLAVYASGLVHRLALDVTTAERMGSYQLEERLGEGGMGEVWKAHHGMLARPAAVKLIRPDMLTRGDQESAEAALLRFEQEARATAQLRSPHTVEVFDFGRADDGRVYYVMELLDGIDLATLVQEFGPQPPARVAAILGQVCHSLDEAHAAGLVHRDIKSANLLLCRYGRDHDFVKVLDFGLVRAADAPPGDSQLTHAGQPLGTPSFMSPEMIDGQTVDGRADLYALGCVAYELLTGSPPFEGANVVATMVKHVGEAPVPPSRRAPASIHPSLEAAVLACLAKAPGDRPATAGDLRKLLDRIEFAEPWGPMQAASWWERYGGSPGERAPNPSAFEPTATVPGLPSS